MLSRVSMNTLVDAVSELGENHRDRSKVMFWPIFFIRIFQHNIRTEANI